MQFSVGVTRREALAGGAGIAVAAVAPVRAAAPIGFLWGVATAAHVVEGNNVNSDYWVLENVRNTGFIEPSGDANDSWDRWREDVALVKSLGLNAYRFSVEWARIEPEPGRFSTAVLDHYRRICAACREAGLTPVVTFHHFTSPRWIAAKGGWENPETADHYARYCERTARAIGDLIDWACTINEPNAQVTSYVVRGDKPFAREMEIRAEAARTVGSDRFGAFFMGDAFKVRDTILVAHARGREAIKAAAPKVKVGLTLALQDLNSGPDGTILYRRIFDEARAPFYAAVARDDFVGVQCYNRFVTGAAGYQPTPPGVERDAWGHEASPNVLAAVVREVNANCAAPIMLTEHGINTLDDAQRVRHLKASIAGMEGCIAQGIPILGYIHWSLFDTWEWGSGYTPRFGLVAVDRQTFARSPKPSAAAYRTLVAHMRATHRWA